MTLVEIMVVVVIMAVVSSVIVLGWSASSQSIDYSVNSAEARNAARLGIDRLTREIRDVQLPSDAYIASTGLATSTPSIVRARQTWLAVFSSFNVTASMPNVSPRLVVYVLYADGTLWRYADINGNGVNDTAQGSPRWSNSLNTLASGNGSQGTEAVETSTWEGASLIVSHVVNGSVADPNTGSSTTDVFRYTLYDSSGNLAQQSPVLGDQLRAGVVAVQIHLLVDLNPSHSPTYIDLQTTAQPRNERQY